MRIGGGSSFSSNGSFETRCEAMLLGKLGSELALVYHDTLQAPLPAGLRRLVEHLDAAVREGDRPALSRSAPIAAER